MELARLRRRIAPAPAGGGAARLPSGSVDREDYGGGASGSGKVGHFAEQRQPRGVISGPRLVRVGGTGVGRWEGRTISSGAFPALDTERIKSVMA